ncbi:MAG: TonB-dependent receptor [Acinetobacter populi]|jgi:iron complex outermembrane receptor protein|uniref:TonB-dependent receptor n=1 Tax=Acinetobacter populi TaxID=1582270 RepID=UPI002355A729|nr:TonB-dependent receptor [Acinetobacter populi]MCH4247177.1 TonB-dependent receptor [Acinetobacter populi]
MYKILNARDHYSHKPNLLAHSILISLAGLSLPTVYAAQNNTQAVEISAENSSEDEKDVKQLETIIVTTRRREEKVQDVPTPITVLSAKTLDIQGLSRVEDLQQALPSLNVSFQNPRQTSIAVRGLGNNMGSDGLEPSVGVYLDNVYLGRPGMAVFDMLDIAQLELLRGPQGTLFGKNTTAGLLNITSKSPTFYPDNNVSISAGERNNFQTKLSLSNALSDTVAGRLSLYKVTQDGYLENTYRKDADKLNDVNRQGLRGQILWEPNDQFNLRWIADYHEQDDHSGATVFYWYGPNNGARYTTNVTNAGGNPVKPSYTEKKISSDVNQSMKNEQGGTSIEANWTLANDLKLTSITAYRFWDFSPSNSDNTSADAIRHQGLIVNDKQYSQELRLASANSEVFDWVTGLYYFQQNLKNNSVVKYGDHADAFITGSTVTDIWNNRETSTKAYADIKSYAGFGQGTWHITPKLDLTAGGRITYEEKTARIIRSAAQGGVEIASLPLAQQATANSQFSAQDTGKMSIHDTGYSSLLTGSYRFNPDQLLYLTYSHGEKSGGFNLSIPNAAGLEALKIRPETVNNYEIGLKQSFLDNRLQLNTNFFWAEVEDYQTTSTVAGATAGTTVSIMANAGEIRTRGFEVDASYQPIQGLTLNLNTSWNDAIYTKYSDAPNSASASSLTGISYQDLTNERVYAVPEWTANFNFIYELKEKNSWQPYFFGSYAWRDWSYGTLDNAKENIINAYGLINFGLGARHNFGDNQFDLSLWVRNLTDKVYPINVLNGYNNVSSATIGQPRLIGATFKLNF